MRKPNSGEVYMYVNLFWLAVGVFVFMPILNNFVLQLVILFTDGNIFYGSLSSTLSTVRDVLGIISSYGGLGVFSVAIINFGKNAFGVIILGFISHGVTLFSSLLTYALYGGEDTMTAFLLLTIDMAVNMAVYTVIYFVLMLVVKKRDTVLNVPPYRLRVIYLAHPLALAFFLAALVYGGTNIVVTLYTMISDFLDPSIGPPISMADTLYWVMEYLSDIVSMCVGYFIMLFVGALAEKYKRSVSFK